VKSLAWAVILGMPAPVLAQAPHFLNYSLGQRWSEVARRLPCQAIGDSRGGGLDSSAHPVRRCQPSDSVRLFFRDDTLVAIRLARRATVGSGETGLRTSSAIWLRDIMPQLVAAFGEPDSVTASDRPTVWGTVLAIWNSGVRRRWQAYGCIEGKTSGETEVSPFLTVELEDARELFRPVCPVGIPPG